jgi:hypothetical protein
MIKIYHIRIEKRNSDFHQDLIFNNFINMVKSFKFYKRGTEILTDCTPKIDHNSRVKHPVYA